MRAELGNYSIMVVYLYSFVTCVTGLNSNKEEARVTGLNSNQEEAIGETRKVSVCEPINVACYVA